LKDITKFKDIKIKALAAAAFSSFKIHQVEPIHFSPFVIFKKRGWHRAGRDTHD